jgi:hypothetical protein
VSETFAVETRSRWDAIALLRTLTSYHAWTIQLGETRWLVVGRADTEADASSAVSAVEAWARDRGQPEITALVGDDVPAVARGRAEA